MGVKHVLKFSFYNYVLFLILLFFPLSFQDWKKTLRLLSFLVISYFFTLITSVSSSLNPKIDVIRFAILFSILLLAIVTILTFKNKIKESILYLFAVAFGIFNSLGFSKDFLLEIDINESVVLPILEAAFGIFSSILLITLALLIITTLLKKVPVIYNSKWMLLVALAIALIALQKVIHELLV